MTDIPTPEELGYFQLDLLDNFDDVESETIDDEDVPDPDFTEDGVE